MSDGCQRFCHFLFGRYPTDLILLIQYIIRCHTMFIPTFIPKMPPAPACTPPPTSASPAVLVTLTAAAFFIARKRSVMGTDYTEEFVGGVDSQMMHVQGTHDTDGCLDLEEGLAGLVTPSSHNVKQ